MSYTIRERNRFMGIRKGPFWKRPGGDREGLILPFVLVLLTILITLGTWFMYSTVQSKNMYAVFYRDDLARMLAESAVGEFRATLYDRIRSNSALDTLFTDPTGHFQGVDFSLADLPVTSEVANSLFRGNPFSFSGNLSVRNVDFELIEEIEGIRKRSTFDREYQATLRLQCRVRMGQADRQRSSTFIYDFDVKRACLRSPSTMRANRGYTTNALNDYVLYIRDSYEEFKSPLIRGKSLNTNDHSLIINHSSHARRGKIFLGCALETDAERVRKHVFLNVPDHMEWLLPDPPPNITVPWSTLSELMPKFTATLKSAIDELNQQGQMSLNPEKIKAVISLEFKPLVGSQVWWQNLDPRVKSLSDWYFSRAPTPTLANRERPIQILGLQDDDQAMCGMIEGNLRQRFWQSACFRLDVSEISSDPQMSRQIAQQVGDKFNTDIRYYDENDPTAPWNDAAAEETTKEVYRVVRQMEQQNRTQLMSMPNSSFSFKPKPGQASDRDSPGTFPTPPLVGRSIGASGQVNYSNFLPFAPFLLRSYRFADSRALYNSPFYDPEKNCLTLRGIFLIEDAVEGLTLKEGLSYSGCGVILCYGDIRLEGRFAKADSGKDGPCILFTYRGNIIANQKSPGLIEASLVALNFKFSPNGGGGVSVVNFSGRKAEVKGNLLADRLLLNSMEKGVPNTITYDSETLNGDLLYCVTCGNRLRSARMIFDDASSSR